MKLLFLTEKPSFKKAIEQEYEKCKDALSFTVDVAIVNNFAIADDDAERFGINTEGFRRFVMNSRAVPEDYKIHLKNNEQEIMSLIQNSEYVYLVNACDPDEAGELMFDYTRESCGLLNYPTLKFDIIAVLNNRGLEAFNEIQAQVAAR